MRYYPDLWVIADHGEKCEGERYAILASWYGGFGGSNSWKRSSPIVRVERVSDTVFECTTQSGAVYSVSVNNIGMSGYTSGIAANAELNVLSEEDGLAILEELS